MNYDRVVFIVNGEEHECAGEIKRISTFPLLREFVEIMIKDIIFSNLQFLMSVGDWYNYKMTWQHRFYSMERIYL